MKSSRTFRNDSVGFNQFAISTHGVGLFVVRFASRRNKSFSLPDGSEKGYSGGVLLRDFRVARIMAVVNSVL